MGPNEQSRRGVLRSAAAGLFAAAGVSGRAAAAGDRLQPADLADRFDSSEAVVRAADAAGLVESLPITRAALAELDREVIDFRGNPMPSQSGGITASAVAGSSLITADVVEGALTPQVMAFVPVEAGTLLVSVYPEYDDGYARLQTTDGVETLVTADVTTQDSCPSCDEQPAGEECFDCAYSTCLDCTYCAFKTSC